MVGAYRDVEVDPAHPLSEALGALPRETRYRHLPLKGLERAEVAELLETIAGRTWRRMNTGLDTLHISGLVIDPITPSTLYAGTRDRGVFSIQQVAVCVGDCNGDGTVSVDELITGVTIALGTQPLEACLSLDAGDDGRVTIDDLIVAVNNALKGCATQDVRRSSHR